MKLDAQQKKIVYAAINDAAIEMFGVKKKVTKGRTVEIVKSIIFFADVAKSNNDQELLQHYLDYIKWCIPSFKKWKEGTADNWVGYLKSHDRMNTFVSKMNRNQTTEIAGKQGESAWTF